MVILYYKRDPNNQSTPNEFFKINKIHKNFIDKRFNKRKTRSKSFSKQVLTKQLTPSNREFLQSLGFNVK